MLEWLKGPPPLCINETPTYTYHTLKQAEDKQKHREEWDRKMDVKERIEIENNIRRNREEVGQQITEVRNVVADLFDTVEDLKREFVTLERDQAWESGSQLREAIDKVSNKKLKDELITKLYALEDKMPQPTRVQRLAPKDNPLRSPLERYNRGY